VINGVEYGKGAFLNKKQSKQMAAEQTLEMLCPGLFPKSKPHEDDDKKFKEMTKVISGTRNTHATRISWISLLMMIEFFNLISTKHQHKSFKNIVPGRNFVAFSNI
jgi:hypothetical protein